jgi:hypothetical protein
MMPQMPRVDQQQAITDLIEALAMQEAAVASVMNAEAAKIDALIAAGMPAATATADVESFQAAVAQVLQIMANRQEAMIQKLEQIRFLMAEVHEMARD